MHIISILSLFGLFWFLMKAENPSKLDTESCILKAEAKYSDYFTMWWIFFNMKFHQSLPSPSTVFTPLNLHLSMENASVLNIHPSFSSKRDVLSREELQQKMFSIHPSQHILYNTYFLLLYTTRVPCVFINSKTKITCCI